MIRPRSTLAALAFTLAAALTLGLAAPASAGILVGYWNFDDGTANDLSENANHGAFVGGATTSADTAAELGGGLSLSLAGNGQRVQVPHSASLFINDTMTLSFWMKATVAAQTTNFIKPITKNNGNTALPGWEMQQDGTSNQLDVRVDPGNETKGNMNGVWDGEWHHIAVILDEGALRTYIDGVLNSTDTYTPDGGFGNTVDLFIGSADGGGRSLVGLLDDVAIWALAVSDSGIAALAQGADPRQIPEPASAALLAVAAAAGLRRRRRAPRA